MPDLLGEPLAVPVMRLRCVDYRPTRLRLPNRYNVRDNSPFPHLRRASARKTDRATFPQSTIRIARICQRSRIARSEKTIAVGAGFVAQPPFADELPASGKCPRGHAQCAAQRARVRPRSNRTRTQPGLIFGGAYASIVCWSGPNYVQVIDAKVLDGGQLDALTSVTV